LQCLVAAGRWPDEKASEGGRTIGAAELAPLFNLWQYFLRISRGRRSPLFCKLFK
jgi:hypothetical protein